ALTGNHKKQLQDGVRLDGDLTSPCKITLTKDKRIEIAIHEGRKRQIKRMFALFKYEVKDLKRKSLGNLSLGDLPVGHWRRISSEELLGLKSIIKGN
ncbi:pseudouridine synthase, partial [Candidatus Omnitrophota bacterium]